MKTLIMSVLLAGSFAALAATDTFKAQFNDFVGEYEVVSCSGHRLSGTNPQEVLNRDCDRKYVHIFLGNDHYDETADGNIYLFNMSNCIGEPTSGAQGKACKWTGIDLATDPASFDPGDQGISVYGSSIQIGKEDVAFIAQSTITKQNDLVYLHRNLTWPQAGQDFLFYDLVLVLKKLK